jgi:ATP-dependent Zn protease
MSNNHNDASQGLMVNSSTSVMTIGGPAALPVFVSTEPRVETIEVDRSQRLALFDHDLSRRAVSIHEAGHLAAGVLLSHQIAQGIRQGVPLKIKAVDVEGATSRGGYARVEPELPVRYPTRADIINSMTVSLSGRAAELIWGGATGGAEHDIRRCTRLAEDLVDSALDLGPDDPLPAHYDSLGTRATDRIKEAWCIRVESVIQEAYLDAKRIINLHRDETLALAQAIFSAGRLSDDRLRAAILAAGLPLEDDGIEVGR